MAFVLKASVSSALGANGGTSSPNIDTTGADLIVVGVVSYQGSAIPTVSDNKSNGAPTGHTEHDSTHGSNDVRVRLYHWAAPTVGSGHNFTLTGNSTFCDIFVLAFSGSNSSPFDVENGAGGDSAASFQGGSVTPSQANSLVVTLVGDGSPNGSETVDSPFTTNISTIAYSGGVNFGGGISYEIQTTATARNPTWSGQNIWRAVANAVFKPPGAAVARQQTLTLLGCGI